MNNFPCRCHKKPPVLCQASVHDAKPLDPKEFKDKHGKRISDGDVLMYSNPKTPDIRIAHTAFITDGDCFIMEEGGQMRRARNKGRWHGERFEIVSSHIK